MKLNQKAQQVIEYLLIVVGVMTGVIGLTKAGGVLPTAVEKSLNKAVETINESYTWRTGTAGACSVTCGVGTASRSVWCERDDGAVVADAYCGGSGTRPSPTVDCDMGFCGTYSWQASGWGACSVACGDGTQSQTVICRDSGGGVAPDSSCSPPKPATSQSCNLGSCFHWDVGTPGLCNQPCGVGTAPVPVSCVDQGGAVVADTNCDAGARPGNTVPCDTTISCGYQWRQSGWGACDATCGNGTKTQTVTCIKSSDLSVVADSNCDAGSKPATSTACNLGPCSHWELTGGWGPCSTICNDPWGTHGTQTALVVCKDNLGNPLPDTSCDATTKPSSTRDCPSQPACGYSFGINPWGECTGPICGTGTHTTQVFCTRTNDGQIVNITFCQSAYGGFPPSYPTAMSGCELNGPCTFVENCTMPCYHWEEASRTPCNNTCGNGILNINYVCKDAANTLVDSALCTSSLGAASPATENCTGTGTCCGNGTLDSFPGVGYIEGCLNCPADGGPTVCCGNGIKEAGLGENCNNCPGDWGPCCPNGVIDNLPGYVETCGNCAADVNLCPGFTSGACGTGSNGCPVGQRVQTRTCSCSGLETQCIDDVACSYSCTGGLSGSATACPGATTGLSSSLPWTYQTSCTGAKCEATCNSPYVAQGGTCVNLCGNGVCDLGLGESCGSCPSECCQFRGVGCGTCPFGVDNLNCSGTPIGFCRLTGSYYGNHGWQYAAPEFCFAYAEWSTVNVCSSTSLGYGAACDLGGMPLPWIINPSPLTGCAGTDYWGFCCTNPI